LDVADTRRGGTWGGGVSSSDATSLSSLTALRALRVVRMFKLVKKWKQLYDFICSLRKAGTAVGPFLIVFVIVMLNGACEAPAVPTASAPRGGRTDPLLALSGHALEPVVAHCDTAERIGQTTR
jgi:hypothetical protein